MRVRNADAAKDNVVAGTEGMHVDAGAGAHVTERSEGRRLRAGEIFGRGDLDVAGLAGKTVTVSPAHSASAASSVKSIASGACCLAVRIEQGGIGEGLRRLHHAQRRTIDGTDDAAARIDRLDGVGHR